MVALRIPPALKAASTLKVHGEFNGASAVARISSGVVYPTTLNKFALAKGLSGLTILLIE
ncbi:unnamed protein product [marine sediment metagenome]|uniref:Uncharacterized protein n=1 Tax=marine sediment metagenome TaxID=412755 RepID=X1QCD2_9ZZZZ